MTQKQKSLTQPRQRSLILRCIILTHEAFPVRREVQDLLLVGVQQLQPEAALVGVAEVPGHVEAAAGFDGRFNVACKRRKGK